MDLLEQSVASVEAVMGTATPLQLRRLWNRSAGLLPWHPRSEIRFCLNMTVDVTPLIRRTSDGPRWLTSGTPNWLDEGLPLLAAMS